MLTSFVHGTAVGSCQAHTHTHTVSSMAVLGTHTHCVSCHSTAAAAHAAQAVACSLRGLETITETGCVALKQQLQPEARGVNLTPSQVAIAKRLNVPLEEYAKHVKEGA